jgi:hypothetical protein
MTSSTRTLLFVLLLIAGPARASGITFGDNFNFTFNGVATLAVCVCALMVLLGYRLMVHSIQRAGNNRGRLSLKFGKFEMNLANAAPGVMFAGLGCVGIVVALLQFAK